MKFEVGKSYTCRDHEIGKRTVVEISEFGFLTVVDRFGSASTRYPDGKRQMEGEHFTDLVSEYEECEEK